jgi:hypothetical protein
MTNQPWASGPGEILQHGLSLLQKDSDKNRRLALLSIDNSVELMLKTYLSLPKRVTNISVSRKEFAEISESFPRLLDAIEQHAVDKLVGIDLGEIEWYHRLRNELYHQGNGLTVERTKVVIYAELARLLFKNLFDIDVIIREEGQELISDFLALWTDIELMLWLAVDKYIDWTAMKRKRSRLNKYQFISQNKVVDAATTQEINTMREFRSKIVYGNAAAIEQLSVAHIDRLKRIIATLTEVIATNKWVI